MRLVGPVLSLAVLIGAFTFTPVTFSAGHSAPTGAKQSSSKPPPKNSEANERMSKKESRMNQRDREMDKRMKRKGR